MALIDTIRRGRDSRPPRLLVYGTEGVGKSTFGAGCPAPVFIQTEDGLGQIDAAKFPKAECLADVKAQLDALRDEPHEFGTLVIDTADWLEKLIWDQVVKTGGRKKISDFPYGQGYDAALVEWQDITSRIDSVREARGMVAVVLAHSKVERMSDPENGDFDRWSPRLYKTANAHLCEWADAILFAHSRVIVDPDTGRARPVGSGGGERVLRTVGSPSVVAKNRYNLPDEIPLSWPAFVASLGGQQTSTPSTIQQPQQH